MANSSDHCGRSPAIRDLERRAAQGALDGATACSIPRLRAGPGNGVVDRPSPAMTRPSISVFSTPLLSMEAVTALKGLY